MTSIAKSDWPEFRGPNQNGQSPVRDLPVRWSETENIRWFSKTVGLGWSSPVVVGDRIYFTSAVNSQSDATESSDLAGRQKLQLVCLNSTDGKELFSKTIFEQQEDAPKIHNKNSHASPTPVVDRDRIYVHFGHQGTACTDLNGNKLWENRDHAFPPTHGNGGSPILADGRLILTCDGGSSPYTLALDSKTGTEVWKTPRSVPADKPFSFCTPQLIEVNGQKQIISPGSNVVQAISPVDGKVIWYVAYDGFSVVPRPLFHQGLVLVCTGFGKTKLLAIDPTGSGDVTQSHVKWAFGTSVPQTPSIVCVGDQVIMTNDSGIATGVSIRDGSELWKRRLGGNYSSSPLVSGDKVYFQSEQGEAIVFQLGDELQEIGRNQLPGRIFASYSIVDRDLIVRAEQGVYRIGAK
jgi:outer membrane protein assembly factor BamB